MAKEAVIVDENSTSLEIAGLQGEPITYDSLATGLMVSSNSCILDEDDESGVIDPSFLMHDAEFAALTTGVFKPLPSRFINVYKAHFAIDKLDNEIEVLSSQTKAYTALGKGIKKAISMLPLLADLNCINPTITTDICFIYGNAMAIFYDKINEAQFVAKGF